VKKDKASDLEAQSGLSYESVEEVQKALCERNFYAFCRLLYPRFYTKERHHLKLLCDTLQALVENKLLDKHGKPVENLLLSLPPRHGKSYTIQNLSKWLLGKKPDKSIITVSYNQSLSIRAGKEVRNAIQERKVQGGRLVYSDVFPNTRIKDGDGAQDVWALEGSHFSYLSTSPTGTLTGAGATGLFIIDDLVKNAYEAFNERILEEHFSFYNDTARSRIETGCKRLVIMTRWATNDLTGKLLQTESEKWHQIILPAYLDDAQGKMLAPDILSYAEYKDRERTTDPVIFQGNYQQAPFDSIDRLYPNIKTYSQSSMPSRFERIEAYIDTADKGADYLAGGVYGVYKGMGYILDILYTQEPMEKTEPMTAKMLDDTNTDTAYIESNNGGIGFARNVSKLLRERGNHNCIIRDFSQTVNKESRILTNATSVCNTLLFPEEWATLYPVFYRDVTRAGRQGKWVHDDAFDMLSGIIEKSFAKGDNSLSIPTIGAESLGF